jgi:hypothetical protein
MKFKTLMEEYKEERERIWYKTVIHFAPEPVPCLTLGSHLKSAWACIKHALYNRFILCHTWRPWRKHLSLVEITPKEAWFREFEPGEK